MDKRSKRILLAFAIAIITLAFVETVKPKPINWSSSYTSVDKIPFGSYIFYNELADFYNQVPVERITEDPYEFLRTANYGTNELYILLNDQVTIDVAQYSKLAEFVSVGNTVLISGYQYGQPIEDSLGIWATVDYSIQEPTISANFFNPSLKLDSAAVYERGMNRASIFGIDSTTTTALGYINQTDFIQQQNGDVLNFVRIPHGDGYFYFHTLPQAFSNYYLLNNNQHYAQRVLSYFDPDKIYWDEYIKSGRIYIDSPLRFVLMQPALKWAYYLTLLGLFLFMVFKGKREQRIVEVVKPLSNDSKDFAATIGDMHFQYKDYGNIIAKRITYFLERVRSEYFIDTTELDTDFTTRLAQKAGQPLADATALVDQINKLKAKALHTEQDLIKLNNLLEKFTQ